MNSIAEQVAQMGSEDQAKAYQARQQLSKAVAEATKPGGSGQASLAAALAAELTAKNPADKPGAGRPKYSSAVRNQLCQFLSEVAGDEQVPALVAALDDLETREMARWGLERVPSPAATAALVKALDKVGPEFRIGVINSLAKKRGAEVAPALHKAAADPDDGVRLAAIEALAQFAEPSHDEPIVAATKNGAPRNRARAQKARIRLAETLRVAGNKNAAITIYRAVIANDADEPQKKAARLALEQLT